MGPPPITFTQAGLQKKSGGAIEDAHMSGDMDMLDDELDVVESPFSPAGTKRPPALAPFTPLKRNKKSAATQSIPRSVPAHYEADADTTAETPANIPSSPWTVRAAKAKAISNTFELLKKQSDSPDYSSSDDRYQGDSPSYEGDSEGSAQRSSLLGSPIAGGLSYAENLPDPNPDDPFIDGRSPVMTPASNSFCMHPTTDSEHGHGIEADQSEDGDFDDGMSTVTGRMSSYTFANTAPPSIAGDTARSVSGRTSTASRGRRGILKNKGPLPGQSSASLLPLSKNASTEPSPLEGEDSSAMKVRLAEECKKHGVGILPSGSTAVAVNAGYGQPPPGLVISHLQPSTSGSITNPSITTSSNIATTAMDIDSATPPAPPPNPKEITTLLTHEDEIIHRMRSQSAKWAEITLYLNAQRSIAPHPSLPPTLTPELLYSRFVKSFAKFADLHSSTRDAADDDAAGNDIGTLSQATVPQNGGRHNGRMRTVFRDAALAIGEGDAPGLVGTVGLPHMTQRTEMLLLECHREVVEEFWTQVSLRLFERCGRRFGAGVCRRRYEGL